MLFKDWRRMTPDLLCYELVRRQLVIVDTDTGRAISVRLGHRRARWLGCENAHGYRVATLHLDGVRKQVKLHRLVWIAAHGIPAPGLVIDHINGSKADNRLANLRLVDARGNAMNRRSYLGIGNPAAKLNLSGASAVRRMYQEVRSYRRVAKAFHVSPSLVAQIIRGERWMEVVACC